MNLFRLDASIRTAGSHTRLLADLVEQEWAAHHPGGATRRREIGTAPLPADAWSASVAAGQTPAAEQTPEQRRAQGLAAEIADELVGADALLFAVPLYNFGVSQHFKTWVDLAVTDPRLAPGGEPPLAGRPAVLATARGGAYGPGTPRAGWDHATGWMTRILADVWGLDLRTVEAELTLAGVNPALDQFREVAEQGHAAAADHARGTGRDLAQRVRVAA